MELLCGELTNASLLFGSTFLVKMDRSRLENYHVYSHGIMWINWCHDGTQGFEESWTWKETEKQISKTLCYCAFLDQGLRVWTKSGIQDLWSPVRPFWWFGVLCHLLVLVVIGQHFHLLTGFMEMPAGLAPAHGAKTHLASIPSKIYEVLWRGRWEAQMPIYRQLKGCNQYQ